MEGLSVVGVRLEIASFLGSADALRFLRLRSDAKRGVEGDDGHLRLHTFDFLSARQGIALLRRVACPAVRVFRVDGGPIVQEQRHDVGVASIARQHQRRQPAHTRRVARR